MRGGCARPDPGARLQRRFALPAAALLAVAALGPTAARAEARGSLSFACDRLDRLGALVGIAGALGPAAKAAAWELQGAAMGADPAAPIGLRFDPEGMELRYRRLPGSPEPTELVRGGPGGPWGGEARARRRASSEQEELVTEDDDGNVVISKRRVGSPAKAPPPPPSPGCALSFDAAMLPLLRTAGFQSLSVQLDARPDSTSTVRAVRSAPIEPPSPPVRRPSPRADPAPLMVVQLGMDLAALQAALDRVPELPGAAEAVAERADRLPTAALAGWGAGTHLGLLRTPSRGFHLAATAPLAGAADRGRRREAARAMRAITRALQREQPNLRIERVDRYTRALQHPEPLRAFTVQIGEDSVVVANLTETAQAMLAGQGAPWLSDAEEAWAGDHHLSLIVHADAAPAPTPSFRAGLRIEAEALVLDLWTPDGVFALGGPGAARGAGWLRELLGPVRGAPPRPPPG